MEKTLQRMFNIKQQPSFTIFLAGLICLISIFFMSSDERYIAVPGFICCLFSFWLFLTLYKRDGTIPFFDAGMICTLVTLVYTVIPLVNYWSKGLHFGESSDLRLQQYNPSPSELGTFFWRYVLYLGTFVVVYALARQKGEFRLNSDLKLDRRSSISIIVLFCILSVYFLILQGLTDINLTASYERGIDQANLTRITYLPLLVKQITFKLAGILFLCKIAVLQLLILKIKEIKWRVVFFCWLFYEVSQPVFTKSTRTEAFIFLLAAGLLYHRLVRPMKLKFLFLAGVVALSGFLFLGVFRQNPDLASTQSHFEQVGGGILGVNNEFQALLGTAYDVAQRKERGAVIPWYVYINDVIMILPPQQVLPFEKVPAAKWYLREIGMSGPGQGFMWGVISQSVVGLDWFELALRGIVLGLLLAWLHRWYMRKYAGFFPTLFYVYLCGRIYYSFRDTTFSPLAFLVWEVIPFYLLVKYGRLLVPKKFSSAKSGVSVPDTARSDKPAVKRL